MKKILLLFFILFVLFACNNEKEDERNWNHTLCVGNYVNIKGAYIQYNGMVNDKVFSISRVNNHISNHPVNLYLRVDFEAFNYFYGGFIYNFIVVNVTPTHLTLKLHSKILS